MSPSEPNNEIAEQYFTPTELAEMFKVHPMTIRRLFIDEPGVIRFGQPRLRTKKQRFILRIPKSVAERVFGRRTVPAPTPKGR